MYDVISPVSTLSFSFDPHPHRHIFSSNLPAHMVPLRVVMLRTGHNGDPGGELLPRLSNGKIDAQRLQQMASRTVKSMRDCLKVELTADTGTRDIGGGNCDSGGAAPSGGDADSGVGCVDGSEGVSVHPAISLAAEPQPLWPTISINLGEAAAPASTTSVQRNSMALVTVPPCAAVSAAVLSCLELEHTPGVILSAVTSTVAQLLGVAEDKVTAQASLASLGMDSMLYVLLLDTLQKHFQVVDLHRHIDPHALYGPSGTRIAGSGSQAPTCTVVAGAVCSALRAPLCLNHPRLSLYEAVLRLLVDAVDSLFPCLPPKAPGSSPAKMSSVMLNYRREKLRQHQGHGKLSLRGDFSTHCAVTISRRLQRMTYPGVSTTEAVAEAILRALAPNGTSSLAIRSRALLCCGAFSTKAGLLHLTSWQHMKCMMSGGYLHCGTCGLFFAGGEVGDNSAYGGCHDGVCPVGVSGGYWVSVSTKHYRPIRPKKIIYVRHTDSNTDTTPLTSIACTDGPPQPPHDARCAPSGLSPRHEWRASSCDRTIASAKVGGSTAAERVPGVSRSHVGGVEGGPGRRSGGAQNGGGRDGGGGDGGGGAVCYRKGGM